MLLGGLGGDVNSLDFYLALLMSLGHFYFYFQYVLSSQWKVVRVNRPLLFILLSHSDNQSESTTKFYNSKVDVG